MATQQLAQPASLTDQAAQLLQLLGGTKTTTSPGDVGALQGTLGQLQGQDYAAMLQSIFQQAGGQIPGLQQALGNAIGARSGGNSAVQAALSKLLAQTSTGAMDQVAKLQSQNLQTQANIGQSIAGATKGTTERKGTDVGGGLANAARLVALLQGTKALGLNDVIKNAVSGTGTTEAAPTAAMNTSANTAFSSPTAPLSTAEAPMFNLTGSFQPTASSQGGGEQTYVPQTTDTGFQFTDMTGFQTPYEAPSYTPSFEAPAVYEPTDYYADTFTFADGGIVRGRGNTTAPMEPSDTPAAETQEEEGEAKSNARYDPGFTANNFLDTFRQLLGANDNVGKAEGYADGGTVRAGGSRRSANPTIAPIAPTTELAQLGTDELRGQFGVQGGPVAGSVATASAGDMANNLAAFGNLSSTGSNGSVSFGGTPGMSPGAFGAAAGKVGAISNVSGALGGPTLGPAAGMLGLAGSLANATSPGEALGAVGKFGANMAVPGLGTLAGFVNSPSLTSAADLGLTAAVPGYGVVAGLMDAFGLATPAQAVENAISLANPNIAMNPEQQAIAAEFAASLNAAPTGLAGDNTSTGYGSPGFSGYGGSRGNMGGSGNTAGPGGGMGGVSGGFGGGAGNTAANGGPVSGPGTGISDSIHNVSLSDGEYVISADTVEALGEDFFNQLQAAFHTPAAQQRKA